ncbi:MAG: ABC transporter permease [Burkholderiales bacterium]|nr:ABC transporter permease [Burkholderiales bacterium]
MKLPDILSFSGKSLMGSRARTLLMILAMSIGVASVVILTALGEGARRYVVDQFSALGTNLLIVFPGRTETKGNVPGMLVGETPRDLTLDDARALLKSRYVKRIAPLTVGSGLVSFGRRNREVPVLGSTSDLLEIRHMKLLTGRFLPQGNAVPVCVLGIKVKEELFGSAQAVGQWVRIGERRFRVAGILAAQGQSLGSDTDELAIIPVVSAQMLFNTPSLFRILIEARSRDELELARKDALEILAARHEGERDVTVITQDAVLATFDAILRALTLAVAGIAGISLGVAGILIMNVMLIAVSQRTREIGLLKAIGASGRQIRNLFFAEAASLSLAGAISGWIAGEIGVYIISGVYPTLPVSAPWWAIGAAIGTALATGILFSLMPARRASQLDPVQALSRR